MCCFWDLSVCDSKEWVRVCECERVWTKKMLFLRIKVEKMRLIKSYKLFRTWEHRHTARATDAFQTRLQLTLIDACSEWVTTVHYTACSTYNNSSSSLLYISFVFSLSMNLIPLISFIHKRSCGWLHLNNFID
jgi:hypothetical protein